MRDVERVRVHVGEDHRRERDHVILIRAEQEGEELVDQALDPLAQVQIRKPLDLVDLLVQTLNRLLEDDLLQLVVQLSAVVRTGEVKHDGQDDVVSHAAFDGGHRLKEVQVHDLAERVDGRLHEADPEGDTRRNEQL